MRSFTTDTCITINTKENNDQFAENQFILVLSLKEIIAESIKYIKTLDDSDCSCTG